MGVERIISYLFPRQVTTTHRERLVSGAGGVIAIFVTAWVAHLYLDAPAASVMVASMGASTVLLFGAPHSPFSQPWSVLGGHLISGVIGVSVASTVPETALAAGLAVGVSITAMFYLRCLHPPGGATALVTVIGGDAVHALGYGFILTPLMVNVAALLICALLVNRMVLGRRYPYNLSMPRGQKGAGEERPLVRLGFSEEDLTAALRSMGGYIDVTGEDLEEVYSLALLHSHQRRLGELRLGDIMTSEVVTVRPDQPLERAWNLLRQRHIRGLPVVDEAQRVVGMLTVADFLRLSNWRMCDTLVRHMRLVVSRKAPRTVERVMSTQVISAPADLPMNEAFVLFARNGINHLPVVDTDGRLSGIVTRLDLLSALYGDAETIPVGGATASAG